MRFLVVSEVLPYRRNGELMIPGGGEAHAFFVARELAKKNHDVLAVAGRLTGMPRYEVVDGIKFYRFGTLEPNVFRRNLVTRTFNHVKNTISSLKLINKVLRENKPDFIIAHPTFCMPRAALLAKLYKIPFIATIHDIYKLDQYFMYTKHYGFVTYLGALYIWLCDIIPKYADMIETGLKYFKGQLISKGIAPRKIFVTGHGVDVDKYTCPTEAKDDIILVLGRLVKHKHVDKAIQVFREVSKKIDVKLFIIGDGPEKESLLKLAAGEENIVFTGFVSEDRKIDILKKSKILLSLSSFEGYNITILEALACGTYPVVSNLPAHREVLSECFCGTVFKTPHHAVDTIVRMLTDEEERKKAIKVGRKIIAEKFTWEKVADRFLNNIQKFDRLGIKNGG